VKPVPFDYIRPSSVAETCALLAQDGDSRVIAGGQSLVPMLAMRLARPERLIDILRLSELAGIKDSDDGIVIGATTRQAAAERDPLIAAKVPLLAEVFPWVGHPATRRRGTIGGSIAHADPSAEIPLVALTLDAGIVVRDLKGETTIKASEFFLGPMVTAIPQSALLTAIRFPVWPQHHIAGRARRSRALHGLRDRHRRAWRISGTPRSGEQGIDRRRSRRSCDCRSGRCRDGRSQHLGRPACLGRLSPAHRRRPGTARLERCAASRP
jgi:CO/xanthine dehydrogenase FAD-binding subunit